MKKPLPHSPYRPVNWFILANRVEAVIYGDQRNEPFHFIDRLHNRKGRAPEYHLVSDREGTVNSSASKTVRHSYEPKETKHEHSARQFAKQISLYLEKALNKKQYDDLTLVAEPHFMGLLRAALKPSVKNKVIHEVKHEYLQGSDDKIRKLIQNAIPSGEGRLNQ
jgi:protein required for attachment to host cells